MLMSRTHTPLSKPQLPQVLHYFTLCYLLALYLTADSVTFASAYANSAASLIFVTAAWLSYSALFMLPALVLTLLVSLLNRLSGRTRAGHVLVYASAMATGAVTSLLLYANAKIFSLYGIFIDGFIINLLMTPGGIASLGGSQASDVGYGIIAAGFVLLHIALMWLAVRWNRRIGNKPRPRVYGYAALLLLLSVIAVQMTYAYHDAFNKNQRVSYADSVPFFQHTSSRTLFTKLGYKLPAGAKLNIQGKLNYPLQPLNIKPPAKPYNIVWLTSESWRADMLDADIMPATWQFAAQAQRFTQNYSGGNGTRMGVFSMFTGLPGNYWFSFLQERRGASIIDVMQQQNYQMSLYTSAMFSYPEFDKTIFSHVPAERLHQLQRNGKAGWENDRINVSDMLDFIDQRDPSRPFFTFMFFESPHARYNFPPESVIRKPYRDDINYATLDKEELRQDIIPIKNRYINAVHHLDSQFARVIEHLRQKQLLDSTIVIMVGDHGEEFMEHGYWGHNSTFVNQQVRTPLVMWVPGKGAGVYEGMTSHMDIVPTLMPLLGVTNDAGDYSAGYDLFNHFHRDYLYISDWSRIAYMDSEVKIVQSLSLHTLGRNLVTTSDDQPLPEAEAKRQLQLKQAAMLHMVQDLRKFLSRKP